LPREKRPRIPFVVWLRSCHPYIGIVRRTQDCFPGTAPNRRASSFGGNSGCNSCGAVCAGAYFRIVGGCIACFFLFLVDTSVATEAGGRVNNLGLMHNQLIGVITGIGLALFGAIVRGR